MKRHCDTPAGPVTLARGCPECAWGKVLGCWRCGSRIDAQRNALVRAHLAQQPRRFEDVTPIEPTDIDLGFPIERFIRAKGGNRELREFVVMVVLLVLFCLGGIASPLDF